MKVRFWKKEYVYSLIAILVLSVVYPVSHYLKNETVSYMTVFAGIIICSLYFLPNYFSNILEITDEFLIIKNGVFQKAINVELDTIKSTNLVTINCEVVSIIIKLHNGNEVPWYTQHRTQEIFNSLRPLHETFRLIW